MHEYEIDSKNDTNQDERKEYNFEDIKKAIKNNPKLTEEEKKFLYKLEFVFDEDNQYRDLDMISFNISEVNIQ